MCVWGGVGGFFPPPLLFIQIKVGFKHITEMMSPKYNYLLLIFKFNPVFKFKIKLLKTILFEN